MLVGLADEPRLTGGNDTIIVDANLSNGFLSTWQIVLAWLGHHEPLLIFLAVLLEESGVPMPLPADIAMALAGLRVAQGRMSLPQAFLIGQSATLIGSSILYWAGRRGGRPLLFRYGKLLHLNAHRLSQVERLITRLGPLSVIIGRQIPGLRLAAPLSCGVFRVRYRLFLPAMFLGSSVYISVFIVLGMLGGPGVLGALRLRELPLGLLVSTALLGATIVLLWQLGKQAREVIPPMYRGATAHRRSLEAAVLAGLGASIIVSLVINWLLDVLGLLTREAPERALLPILERSASLPAAVGAIGPARLVLAGLIATIPVQVTFALFWAAAYAFLFEPRLRGSAALRGLQFAVLPWLFTMAVVFPFIGAGVFGTRLGDGHTTFVAVVGEVAHDALFGALLATLYRLIRLARLPRPHQGHRHGHRHAAEPVPARAPARAGTNGATRPVTRTGQGACSQGTGPPEVPTMAGEPGTAQCPGAAVPPTLPVPEAVRAAVRAGAMEPPGPAVSAAPAAPPAKAGSSWWFVGLLPGAGTASTRRGAGRLP